jgi:D-alanyl-D-alanine carboxypeptidase/D-alanyl-D-alanine-endopeptidase (penicillin-binding protein 4)
MLVPASLSKLITEGAILNTMSPSYKYKTQLMSAAPIKGNALAGDLILKGGGDPSFVSENMWILVNNFTRTGVTSVEGDIIVDDSRFDSVRFSESRESTRVDRAYDAPVGAMSMNWNSVNVYVRPGASSGEPCIVVADPVNTYIRVKNECRTGGRGKNFAVERKSEKGFWGDVITVTGKIGKDQDEAVVYKSISQPDLWSGANLLEFLRHRGISVKGKVKNGVAPKEARTLAFVESKPLSEILADMAKFSNNYVAEMFVKNLAAENGTLPATMQAGLAVVQKFLNESGFPKSDIVFTSPSGFTMNNKVSASQLGRYLVTMQSNFSFFPEYVMALPIAGIDGTLRHRMKGTAAERWVRAKTGLLNGVVGLAGYAGGKDGGVLDFAFIFNGPAKKEAQARNFFDRMAAALVQLQE